MQGDVSYTRGSGSGGYSSNSLAATVGPSGLPVVIGLDLSQSLLENMETSMQLGATLGWRASPLWMVTGHLTVSSDEFIHVNGHGVSVAWNVNKLWLGRNSTRLELARDLYDYSSPAGVSTLNGHIPQQGRTRVDVHQELGDNTLDVYMTVDNYDYSVDPIDLARALLNRKVRRVVLAGKVGNLLERSQTLGVNWSMSEDWSMDFSLNQSKTVVGQNQRQNSVSITHMFRAWSATLTF